MTVADDRWRDHAVCRGLPSNLFYCDLDDSKATRQAKRICAACPVQPECLDYALTNHEHHGIWGGRTARERYKCRGWWAA